MASKILIVDDSADIREIIKLYLENAGYEVREAVNGLEALNYLKEYQVDLMILDIMMPAMDGYKLMRLLGDNRTFPVIFLSAKDRVEDKIKGLNLGGDDYISKPFDPGELIARIIAVLRRAAKEEKLTDVIIGNLRWDPDFKLIYKDGEALNLRAKEYKLLSLFMKRPGKVFTKQEIYEFLWEEPYYNYDNTIMVHISYLREKIEEDPRKPEKILTIKGLGYMMKGD